MVVRGASHGAWVVVEHRLGVRASRRGARKDRRGSSHVG
jgi:hypothetical protein